MSPVNELGMQLPLTVCMFVREPWGKKFPIALFQRHRRLGQTLTSVGVQHQTDGLFAALLREVIGNFGKKGFCAFWLGYALRSRVAAGIKTRAEK